MNLLASSRASRGSSSTLCINLCLSIFREEFLKKLLDLGIEAKDSEPLSYEEEIKLYEKLKSRVEASKFYNTCVVIELIVRRRIEIISRTISMFTIIEYSPIASRASIILCSSKRDYLKAIEWWIMLRKREYLY